MAGTSSIGGLASGLETATIINQLMALEATSQTRLKSQVTTEQGKVAVLQRLNTALQSLASAAKDMAAPSTSTWSALTATSSNTGVSIAATTAASPGAFSVTVGQTARTHQIAFTEAHARTDVVAGTGVVLRRDGRPDLAITTANGTLEELAAAINTADAGVRATLVRTGSTGGADQFRLLVESSATGAAQAFELTDGAGAPLLGGATVRAGRDASIEIGGITATSTTNTFADVVPGVTITLGGGANGTADLVVKRDAAAQSSAAKGFVDQVNALLGQISALTANGPDAKGQMAGDSTLRRVADALKDAIYPPDGTSMATFGVQVDRYGKLVFNEKTFLESYAADPVAVAAAFTGAGGFAARIQDVAEAASDKYEGSVTNAITSHTTTISRLNERIADWDDRLELRRATLERQYTALETALSRLNGQSEWLTSQLESLSASTQ